MYCKTDSGVEDATTASDNVITAEDETMSEDVKRSDDVMSKDVMMPDDVMSEEVMISNDVMSEDVDDVTMLDYPTSDGTE